jgi:hypothetical protein
MKNRGFRPAVDGARLEDRIVLSQFHHLPIWFVPPTGVTSAQTVSFVGAAINIAFQQAGKAQATNTAAFNANTITAQQYAAKTLTIFQTNLEAGLKAATDLLPDGNLLFAQLTAPTTKLGGIIKTAQTQPPNGAAISAATTPAANLAARTEANGILKEFIRTGVTSRGLRVIGYGLHGSAYIHFPWALGIPFTIDKPQQTTTPTPTT